MKQLLLITVFFFGFSSTSIAQKSQPSTAIKKNAPEKSSPGCPLSLSIQDDTPSAVCSELLKTLVAVTSVCTDTNAVNYRWSSSVGGVFSTSRTTTFNLPEFLVATPVTFTVWVIEGTDSLSANYSITVKPRPSRPTLTPFGTIILCDNNAITLTSSACTGGSTTIWSNGISGVSSISVSAIGGTYFKVACEKNGCVSDSTAAAALTTGTVTASPTVTNRTICEGTTITAGNGLQAQLVNCGATASGTYTYTGPTVGYDQGYRNSGGVDPKVTVPSVTSNISNIKISVTWRKQKGGFQNSCGVGDTESWPYHNETQFRVQSPSGRIITLVNTSTYGGSNNPTVTTVFEDGATPVNFYSPPVSGTFAPAQPLSGFIGENPTGTWTLLPYDNYWKDPLCVSGFAVTFTADAQVGTLTWWDAPTGGNQVGTGSEFIPTNTVAGTHTYYAQGQCARGCPSVRTAATLTIQPTPPAPTISVNVPDVNGTKSICYGDPITLTATGCTGTVKWSSNQNGTNFATGTTYTFTPSGSNFFNTTHSFTAICEGSNLCKSVSSNTISVVVKYKPAQPTISGPGSSICVNSNITLTASACSGGTLGWTGNRSGSSINFILTSAVSIKVACTVNGCTSDSSNVYSITTLPRPSTPTVNASQIQALCLGDGVTLSSSCANGTTTKWTGNLSGSPITVYPITTRNYRASCLGTNGCSSDSSAALTIVVLPKTKPTITGSTFICGTGAGISVTLKATGCSGVGETVMWRNQDTGLTFTETISQTRTFRTVCIRGGYCVSDSSDIFTVQYRNKPSQPTITPPQNTTICQGASVSLTASACVGGTLGWTGGLSGQSISISAVGTKSYKVACTINGCTSDSSLSVTVTVNPKPSQPTITSSGNIVCQGTNVTLTSSVCINGTYGWTGGFTTSSITISSIGTRNYKVACTLNGCTSDSSAVTTVQVKAKPSQPTITPPQNTAICQGASISLTANACTGGTLGWTGGLTGQTVSVSPNVTKSYKVACLVNGCLSDSSSAVTITVNPTPIINVSANKTSVCSGDSAILTVSGCTGAISWSNGATTAVIKVSPVVNTTYTATCTLGTCSANQSVSITALSTPNITASGILQCGQTVTLTANNVPVGSSIQWRKDGVDITGATGTSYSTSVAGSYDFTVGATFSLQLQLNTTSASDIRFVDSSNGYVFNVNNLWKTTNGGTNWVNIYSHISNFEDVYFIDSYNGWAITQQSILKTINGGLNWTVYSNSWSGLMLSKLQFKDVNTGIILTNDGRTLSTTNGGVVWNLNTNPIESNVSSWQFNKLMYIPNTNNILLAYRINGNSTAKLTKSTDNGASWTVVSLPNVSYLSSVYDISFANSNNGWLVGYEYDKLLLKTTDGGNTWTRLNPIMSSGNYLKADFVSSQIGYVIGFDGSTYTNRIYKTQDGGSTWNTFRIIENDYINTLNLKLDFTSEDNGWYFYLAANVYQYILRKASTPQCPTTPLVVAPPQRPNAPTITPLTNSTICQGSSVTLSATGCTGGTYAWTGGLTGTSISVSPSSTRAYKVACTLNTCVSDSSLVVTITVNPKPSQPTISQTNPSICVGQSTTLSVTSVNGATYIWTGGLTGTSISVSPTATRVYKVAATISGCVSDSAGVEVTTIITPIISSNTLDLCNNNPITFSLNNAEENSFIQWRKNGEDIPYAINNNLDVTSQGVYNVSNLKLANNYVESPIEYALGKAFFINPSVGWIGGNNKIIKTVDGGNTWNMVYTNVGNNNFIGNIQFINPSVGWAYGNNNNSIILKTIDGGQTWVEYTQPVVPNNILGMKFRDVNNGLIVGYNIENTNRVHYTNNGGDTWNLSTLNINFSYEGFVDIAFIPNSSNCWIIGNAGSVYKSTNNGVAWTLNYDFQGALLHSIYFLNAQEGWITGGDGFLAKTINGGGTWNIISNSTLSDQFITSVHFTNSLIGWIGVFNNGSSGEPNLPKLMKTIDGGDTWFSVFSGDNNFGTGITSMQFVDNENVWLQFSNVVKKMVFNQCPIAPVTVINSCCSIFETIKSGSWTDPATWSCNRAPTAADDVIINTGHTIINNSGTIRAKSLNYRGGNLQISSTSNLILGN